MSVTVEEINRVAALALGWAYAKHAEGVCEGFLSASSEGDAGMLERVRKSEQEEFEALVEGFRGLRAKVTQGYESEGGEAVAERRTIRTLEELDDLPVNAVVLEDQYEAAYQKHAQDSWSGDGRYYDAVQIDLPCTVVYEPGVK
jgi:hypothetical protein